MWTCAVCGRTYAIRHQAHSCIDLALGARLSEASERAVTLFRAIEAALAACGEVRIHPQKTRIAFVSTMTFAGVKLAHRWVDLSLVLPEPIDDPRIRTIECYGPTSFVHTLRIADPDELDPAVRRWLCMAKRRGDQDTLDPHARAEPLAGRPLEVVRVPVRCRVAVDGGVATLWVPRHAAEIFGAHRAVQVRRGRKDVRGRVEMSGGRPQVVLLEGPEALGAGAGEAVDVILRAEL